VGGLAEGIPLKTSQRTLAPRQIAQKKSICPDFGASADRSGAIAPGDPIKSDQKTWRRAIWYLAMCWLSAVALFTGFKLLTFERQTDGSQSQS
jgi:hypothetical protein